MNRIKILIVILFIAALGTGFVVGMGVARSTIASGTTSTVGGAPGGSHPTTRPSLTEALALTPAQSEQLKAIWSDWDPSRQTRFDRHQQCQKDRDDSIQTLLTDSQKPAYDDIQKKYRQELDKLDEERHQAFLAAVEKTKAILNESQRAKYDEILKSAPQGHGPRGGDHGGGDHGRGPSSRHGPTTQPTAIQQF